MLSLSPMKYLWLIHIVFLNCHLATNPLPLRAPVGCFPRVHPNALEGRGGNNVTHLVSQTTVMENLPVRWKIMESHSAGTSCSVYFNILSLCCRRLPTFTSQLFCLEWTSESPLCMVRGRGRGCGWANRAASRCQIQIDPSRATQALGRAWGYVQVRVEK